MALNSGPRRGELVTIAIGGDYGKPRPALVMQSDAFVELPSVTVLRITSELHEWPLLRITVAPTEANGLRKPSQVMIDKAATVPRAKLGSFIGRLEADSLRSVERALQAFLGLEGAVREHYERGSGHQNDSAEESFRNPADYAKSRAPKRPSPIAR